MDDQPDRIADEPVELRPDHHRSKRLSSQPGLDPGRNLLGTRNAAQDSGAVACIYCSREFKWENGDQRVGGLPTRVGRTAYCFPVTVSRVVSLNTSGL